MKRILIFITIGSFFFSCKSKDEESTIKDNTIKEATLKDIAENQFLIAIDEMFPHGPGNAPAISENRVVYADDSLYVYDFTMKYQNEFGGFSRNKFEYIVAVQDSNLTRYLIRIREHEYSDLLLLFGETLGQPHNAQKDSIEQLRIIHNLGVVMCITYDGGKIYPANR